MGTGLPDKDALWIQGYLSRTPLRPLIHRVRIVLFCFLRQEMALEKMSSHDEVTKIFELGSGKRLGEKISWVFMRVDVFQRHFVQLNLFLELVE